MANRGRFKKSMITHNFLFEDGLQSNVRAQLVIEMIKYLLYQREQLPFPFDQLKRDTKQGSQTTEGLVHPRKRSIVREIRKAITAITNLDQIFEMISHMFEICPEIGSILILFGTTPISPRESYLLNMPRVHPEWDSLTIKNSIRTLFRQIVSDDVLGNVKRLSPTHMIVMVHAPKDRGIFWFLPKPHFKLPVRGKCHVFNFQCKQQFPANNSFIYNESTSNISGIEPLESSGIDTSIHEFATRLSLSGDEDSVQDSTKSLLESLENSEVMISNNNTVCNDTDTSSSGQNRSSISISDKQDCKSFIKQTDKQSPCITSSGMQSSRVASHDTQSPRVASDDPHMQSKSSTDRQSQRTTSTNIQSPKSTDTFSTPIYASDSSYFWFQAPVFVKGYKDRTSKHANFL